MPFNAILKVLSENTGATGTVLIDWEGEVIAYHSPDGLDMPLIGAHQGIVLDRMKEASRVQDGPADNGGGSHIKSAHISTDRAVIYISTLKEDLSLVVIAPKKVPVGKLLFESKKAVKLIEIEMG